MGKYHLTVFLLLCANVFAAGPLAFKMEGKFLEDADGPKTVHEWSHTVYAPLDETTVANEARRKNCSGKTCLEEQFRTEISPTRAAPDLIRAKISFLRTVGDESTRIDGTIFARPGEQGEFRVDTTLDTRQRYIVKMTPLADPKH